MFAIFNADNPTGFYLIKRLISEEKDVLPILTSYYDKKSPYLYKNIFYLNKENGLEILSRIINKRSDKKISCVFYLADHNRMNEIDFINEQTMLNMSNIPVVNIIDWSIYNGVKRGNLPVDSTTATRPDSYSGVDKVWLKTFAELSAKHKNQIANLIYPSALSPLMLTNEIRINNEYFLARIIYDIIEAFKNGVDVVVNKNDLKVVYDIVHSDNIAQAAIDIFKDNERGSIFLSSNKTYTLKEILEELGGALIHMNTYIPLANLNVKIKPGRRSLINYDTHINTINKWSNSIRNSKYNLYEILDEIIKIQLNINKENEIVDKIILL